MIRFVTLAILLVSATAPAFAVPGSTSQCIVGITDDWSSSRATLYLFEKNRGKWKPVGEPIAARLGRSGLAWGSGLHPVPGNQAKKKEGDWKAPAGIFELGGVWGYPEKIKCHRSLSYRRITGRDLWVEDSSHKLYNQHVVLDHAPETAWEKKQQMRQSDPAHSLKLFIKHNAAPNITPGMGSSIFFHIWRSDGAKATAGCTTMAKANLERMIAWINPTRKPVYILLPRSTYKQFQSSWKLPAIE